MSVIFDISTLVFFSMFVFVLFNTMLVTLHLLKKEKNERSCKNLPGVSVIIPTYNEEENIRETLNALIKCDYPKEKLEIIVVDDGSKDRTIETVKSFKNVVLIRQEHEGKARALNAGVSRARFNLILTLDADTTLEKNAIKEVVKHFKDETVGAVNGVLGIKHGGSLLKIFQHVEFLHSSLLMEAWSRFFGSPFHLWGAFACYRKGVLKKIGGFKKTFTEDFDVLNEIVAMGYKVTTCGKSLAFTSAPLGIRGLFDQRRRWFVGNFQGVMRQGRKNHIALFHLYIFFYLVVSFPLLLYHIAYWIPYNSSSPFEISFYFLRWFSIVGPLYMIYMIPEWGINWVYIFGVAGGIASFFLLLLSLKVYEGVDIKKVAVISFFFPYYLLLSGMAFLSLFGLRNKGYFIK